MKKLALALSILGLTTASTAFAGAVEYQEPVESGKFIVALEGWYMQPGHSEFIFSEFDTVVGNFTDINRQSIDVDYDWGAHVDLGYVMPGDGFDFMLSGSWIDSEGSKSVNSNGDTFGFVGPFNGTAQGETSYRYWDVDFVVGKEYVVQNRYHFHPFAGVRYVNFKSGDHGYYHDPRLASTFVGATKLENEFDGVGPRVGFNTKVEFENGFGLVGRAAGSLTIGEREYEITNIRSNGNLAFVPPFMNATQFLKKTDNSAIIPEVDYRVGLSYDYAYNPGTSFGFEIGWQAFEYFEVIDRSNQRLNAGGAAYANWGEQGPYLRFEASIA